ETSHGTARHMFGEVTTALELGQHAQDGYQVAQLVGPRLAQGELALGQLLDVAIQRVDRLVALGEYARRLSVPVEQTVGAPRHALTYQGEELDHLAVDVLEGLGDLICVAHLHHDPSRHGPTVAPSLGSSPSGSSRR